MTDSKPRVGDEARELLATNYQGVLSTQSQAMPGFPFGSVVPYCLDHTGQPIILISQIAQHTKNILADAKASLITFEQGADDIQAAARLTLIGEVTPLVDDEIDQAAERYYRYFPQSQDYHKVHDFDFYRLNLVRLRFIGGFGRINWLEPDQVVQASAFDAETERGMIEHMNDDHISAMQTYCEQAGIDASDQTPVMISIDQNGFNLRLDQAIKRFHFDEPASTPEAIRKALVAMARR